MNLFIIIIENNFQYGDWGLAQSPIPNPQSPIPNPHNNNNIYIII